MAPKLSRNAHCLEIPYYNGPIYSPGSEIIAVAIEADASRMAGPDRVRYILGVVLEEIIVGEEEVHLCAVWWAFDRCRETASLSA